MTVTLPGGNSDAVLYYSNAQSVGYKAAVKLDTTLKASFPSADIQTDTTTGGSSGTDTASTQPVLLLDNNAITVTAANYSAIIDGSIGPVTLYFKNDSGSTSVLAGSGGGQFFLADEFDATIVAGDGNYWVGHPVVDATGSMDVTLGNGNDTINDLFGASTITTGIGNTVVNLYEGNSIITFTGAGNDTVNAGVEGNTNTAFGVTDAGDIVSVDASSSSAAVLISENLAQISFTNGSGDATIRGGNGSTTINAGGTGTVFYSAESYDFFIGSASPSSLSDMVTDNSTTNDTLVAGAGTTTINALASAGNVLIEAGTGSATLEGGTGSDTFEVQGLTTGSHTLTVDNWTTNDTLELQGFGGLTNITYATVSAGVTATLTDGTVITFTGITDSSEISGHVTSI